MSSLSVLFELFAPKVMAAAWRVITKQELQNPPAEQSASMQRGQASAHDGIWAGFAIFPGSAWTRWPTGDHATYTYITSGAMTVEFGPGAPSWSRSEGDFIYIPRT